MSHGRTHLDLFTGIGGFSLGLGSVGYRTIAFSEIDPIAAAVFSHHFPGIPNLGDIKLIDWQQFLATHGRPYIVTGGVPCQPASTLGQMRGTADPRWLWPEVLRMAREVRPRFCIFENPPSLLVLEGGRAWNGIVSGLVACGYDLWWDVFPAAAFGAGHLRERVILVCSYAGYPAPSPESERQRDEMGWEQFDGEFGGGDVAADSPRREEHQRERGELAAAPRGWQGFNETTGTGSTTEIPSNTDLSRLEGYIWNGTGENATGGGNEETGRSINTPDLRGRVNCEEWWHETNTGIPVLADGIPGSLVEAACRCFGNAVVPQIPYLIGQAINELEKEC